MLPLRAPTLAAALAAFAGLVFAATPAFAQEARACIDASVAGQEQRDHGHFLAARASFVACARETCPAPVRRDCGQWLAQVDDAMPSILIAATDAAGRDLEEVSVSIDGELLLTRLDGMPRPLDPGPHTLRCDAPGRTAVELPVIVRAGEKNRVLQVRFGALAAAARGPTTPVPRAAGPGATLGWIFGGVAVAAFASEAYFGISGLSQRNRDTAPGACAPACPPSEKSDVQTKFLVADVSLGVGLAAAATAIYFFVRWLGDEPGTGAVVGRALDVSPALLRGSF